MVIFSFSLDFHIIIRHRPIDLFLIYLEFLLFCYYWQKTKNKKLRQIAKFNSITNYKKNVLNLYFTLSGELILLRIIGYLASERKEVRVDFKFEVRPLYCQGWLTN